MIRKDSISAVVSTDEVTHEVEVNVGTVIRRRILLPQKQRAAFSLGKDELLAVSIDNVKRAILAVLYGSLHTELRRIKGACQILVDRMKQETRDSDKTSFVEEVDEIKNAVSALVKTLDDTIDEKETLRYETLQR